MQVSGKPKRCDQKPMGKQFFIILSTVIIIFSSHSLYSEITPGQLLPDAQIFSGWKKIDAIWVAGKIVMANKQTGHTTILEIRNVKLNVGVEDDLFRDRSLKKGLRKKFF